MNVPTTLAALGLILVAEPALPSDLASAFTSPAESAKPRTYWFHMSGNITKPGITADLEAMKAIGLGGTLFMNVSVSLPPGLVETKEFMSPPWQDCFQHMLKESARLGLDFGSALCDGWGNAGGPEIPPELAMQRLTWSESLVSGGQTLEIAKLPQPETLLDTYRDIATLAFPCPPADLLPPVCSRRDVVLTRRNGNGAELQFDLAAPATVRDLTLTNVRSLAVFGNVIATIQASDDGTSWRTVEQFPCSWRGHPAELTLVFDPVTARHFRLTLPAGSFANGDRIQIGDAAISNRDRVHLWQAKAAFLEHPEHGGGASRFLDTGAADLPGIPLSSIIPLTGKATWTAPEGKWIVLRIGHTPTGAHNAPATKAGVGLECDKLDPRGVEAQHRAFVDRMLASATSEAKKAFKHTWIDSWEVGIQNWTASFPAEFKARRGYDITPWLLVLAGGRIAVSRDQSERFLWDFRRTLADLFVDHYWQRSRELAHQRGLEFRAEAFGRQQFLYDPMNFARANDMPCGEFWVGGGPRVDCKVAASAAHLSGRQVAGAEAFTAGRGRWLDDPWSLKTLGDRAFCLGVNQYYFHRYAHQPWMRLSPGMTFGPYGINFERTNTWWRPGKAWIEYLTRCQSLLQQGRFAADSLVMLDEGAPSYGGWKRELSIPLPEGYDYDFANLDALRESRADRGVLVHPSGMRYRVLILPGTGRATPALMREVLRLAEAGVAIASPRDVTRAQGRTSDEEIAALWSKILATGNATVAADFAPVATKLSLSPDFAHDQSSELLWIHRTDDAGTDWYFVSNQSDRAFDAVCRFRVTGRQPELWDPSSGRMRDAGRFREQGSQTAVQIPFDPRGSWFVVFRQPASPLAEPPDPPQVASTTGSPASPGSNRELVDNFTLFLRARPTDGIDLVAASNRGITSTRGQNFAVVASQGELAFGPGHVTAGVSVGHNGVIVWEHGARYLAPRLVVERPMDNVTEIAVFYRDRAPTLYLDGQPAGNAPASSFCVHPGATGSFHGELDVQVIPAPLDSPAISAHARRSGPAPRHGFWIEDGHLVEEVEQTVAALDGAWEVSFEPGRGAPSLLHLDRLADLSRHAAEGVRHFAGTASYRKQFQAPREPSQVLMELDLGTVHNLAEVFLNGQRLGVLWKRPFRIAAGGIKDGINDLEIRVTNLWVNRLIGDAKHMSALGVAYAIRNDVIQKWPDWVAEDAPPQDAPVSFATWRQWTGDEPLQPSGLIGPVTIRTMEHRIKR